MAQLSQSIQHVLSQYNGINEMFSEADVIANRLSPFFDSVPAQAFQNAQAACQQHLHQLMLEVLDHHGGDLEDVPEARSVIRTIFQLSILRNIFAANLSSRVA